MRVIFIFNARGLRIRNCLGSIQSNQSNEITSSFTTDHCLTNQVVLLQHIFKQRRCYFLSGGCDYELLLATDNLQKAILIEFAEVARKQPTIIEDFRILIRCLVVTTKHHFAANQNLFVSRDSDVTTGHRWSNRAKPVVLRSIKGNTYILG